MLPYKQLYNIPKLLQTYTCRNFSASSKRKRREKEREQFKQNPKSVNDTYKSKNIVSGYSDKEDNIYEINEEENNSVYVDIPKKKFPSMDEYPIISQTVPIVSSNQYTDTIFDQNIKKRKKSQRVCIIGTPNSGKSTLINSLTKSLISAMSPKRHTTRQISMGIFTDDTTQIIQYDTPGIENTKKLLLKQLSNDAWDCIKICDTVLLIIDIAKRLSSDEYILLKNLNTIIKSSSNTINVYLVLNKIDLVTSQDKYIQQMEDVEEYCKIENTFAISAQEGTGISEQEDYQYKNSIEREWEFPCDLKTTMTDIEQATEIIRQELYRRYHKEIPYTQVQKNLAWDAIDGGGLRIVQQVIVLKDHHRDMIIGKNGSAIKQVVYSSRELLEAVLQRDIDLHINVIVG